MSAKLHDPAFREEVLIAPPDAGDDAQRNEALREAHYDRFFGHSER